MERLNEFNRPQADKTAAAHPTSTRHGGGACKSSTGLDSEDRRGLQRPALGSCTCLSTGTVDNMPR
jgi:hypothetical protein